MQTKSNVENHQKQKNDEDEVITNRVYLIYSLLAFVFFVVIVGVIIACLRIDQRQKTEVLKRKSSGLDVGKIVRESRKKKQKIAINVNINNEGKSCRQNKKGLD